jgi:hypothetical protein
VSFYYALTLLTSSVSESEFYFGFLFGSGQNFGKGFGSATLPYSQPCLKIVKKLATLSLKGNKLTNNLYYRHGISNMAAAAIGNGLLKDLGFIDENDHIDVLDASKIMRDKARICAENIDDRAPDLTGLTCIGLDSKRDSNVPQLQEVIENGVMRVFKTLSTVDNLTFTVESGNVK